ncbi:MAG: hypothetical protein AB7W16_17105 [Candidatus Obscuribacterales bacterium]
MSVKIGASLLKFAGFDSKEVVVNLASNATAARESKMIDTSFLSKADKELCRTIFEMLAVPTAEISSFRPRLAKFDIDQACLWFAIGTMMKMQGLNEAAIETFKIVVLLDPKWTEAWGDLATVLRAAGKTDESAEAEKKFLELGGSREEKVFSRFPGNTHVVPRVGE